jgi:hypothetical protein
LAKKLTQLTPGNISISLIDANLNMVFITSQPYGAPGFKIHHPEDVRAVLQTQKSAASAPIYSPIWKQWVVAVTVPVVRKGVTEYVLRMVMNREFTRVDRATACYLMQITSAPIFMALFKGSSVV